MESNLPKKINKYDVLGVIGRGGMGVVYKAIDRSLDRLVAIKMVTSADDPHGDLLKRFYREAQFTANLRHQNIVVVYELGDFEGRPYLVMEYLAGQSLESMLARQPMNLQQRVSHVRQVCNGLHYAHSRQPSVIHRDIKPANIVVLEDGTAKIVDFGIARLDQSNDTRSGQIMGSYHYMSPEQIENEQLDGRTDIFSAGVVLYQLLTLTLPFEGSGIAQTLHRIVKSPPPPLNQFLKEYPASLDDIIARSLAKNRNERYQTAAEFAFDLMQVEEELGRGLYADHIQRAELFLNDGDLDRAKQELVRILDTDRQHTRANELMREVQQAINRQHRKKRARDLRVHAEEALEQNQLNDALGFLDQAISLDNTDPKLQAFREHIVEMQTRGKKVAELLDGAERACASHELEAAARAVEEALELDPSSARARTLKPVIAAKVLEREKNTRLQELLASARQALSENSFAQALEHLRQAEQLDPTVSGLRGLIAVAEFGYQEQMRQKVVEHATSAIQSALNKRDASLARNVAASALEKFPQDRSLLDLKASMEAQIDAQREERLAQIRGALKTGDYERAEQVLATAEKDLGNHPDFQKSRDEISAMRSGKPGLDNDTVFGPVPGELKPDSPVPPGSWHIGQPVRKDDPGTMAQKPASRVYERSVAELTPLEGIPAPPARERTSAIPPSTTMPPPAADASQAGAWSGEFLNMVEKQLARFIGPLAKVAVKRASAKTANVAELYDLLAVNVTDTDDKKTFLALRGKTISGATQAVGKLTNMTSILAESSASRVQLTQPEIDQAAKLLAPHVGPLANLLAKRAAQQATSLKGLYGLLAQHIDSRPDRTRFLREAGFPDA